VSSDTRCSARAWSRSPYQGIFAELYRRFGVSSYKLIPQAKYQAVLTFLDDWRQRAVRPAASDDATE
jgi:hypothetical protein